MKDDAFRRHFERERKAVYDHTMAYIQNQAGQAARVLTEIMNTGIVESARVAACREILSNAYKWVELTDILDRLEALEAKE